MAYFTQGFSYTKTPEGQNPQLLFSNQLKFYLTPKWYVDFYVSYIAQSRDRMDYYKLKPNDKRLTVVRDLHCWILRMNFLKNATRTEASFYIDLKTNMGSSKSLFNQNSEPTFYQDITHSDDPSTIFPSPK